MKVLKFVRNLSISEHCMDMHDTSKNECITYSFQVNKQWVEESNQTTIEKIHKISSEGDDIFIDVDCSS